MSRWVIPSGRPVSPSSWKFWAARLKKVDCSEPASPSDRTYPTDALGPTVVLIVWGILDLDAQEITRSNDRSLERLSCLRLHVVTLGNGVEVREHQLS